jgi:hypothetical protein
MAVKLAQLIEANVKQLNKSRIYSNHKLISINSDKLSLAINSSGSSSRILDSSKAANSHSAFLGDHNKCKRSNIEVSSSAGKIAISLCPLLVIRAMRYPVRFDIQH